MRCRKLVFPSIVLMVVVLLTLGCDALQGLVATPTAVPTHTPTATNIPTATHTPIPSPTPTTASALPPDLSGLVLTLNDLPPGFQVVSLEEFGLTREALSGDGLIVESVFAFMEYERFEFSMGFTTLLPTRVDQAAFDAELAEPDYLIEAFVVGLGATGVTEQSEIPGLDIGDAAAGITVVAGLEGVPMRMDMLVFRDGTVGAFVVAMYLEGDTPLISIEEIARRLEARISEFF